ncbi:MAG: DNA-binding response regulator [Bacteroidetes bacterium]|nr:MAG: DNA-binding response regulator [Bacteroidota bacterium]
MIKAFIVDDDPGIRATNRSLLAEYFTDIELVGEADSVDSAFTLISELKPHLVLLDIEIKGGTGFQLLQKLKPYSFKVVFITAFNNFAIKAIKFNALDYILKPVNSVEFQKAIESAVDLISKNLNTTEQTEYFLQNFNTDKKPKKIILRTTNALHLVNVSDILYGKNDNSYTTFYLSTGEKIMVSKGIVFYEDILSESGFFRPHQSYLVNLQHVKRLDKTDGGFVILDSNNEIPVSSRRKKGLIKILENL